MTMSSISLLAPAKINAHLSVLKKRSDGYHLLDTLMIKIDLADEIKLDISGEGIRLCVTGEDLPDGSDNIVYQAAEKFYRKIEKKPSVQISLSKRIPISAGLGGGSSDAAHTLLGLNRLHGLPLDLDELKTLGLSLGADVPFFLFPETAAHATGIGEELRPATGLPEEMFLVIVNPGWELSTAWVFRNYTFELTTRPKVHIYSNMKKDPFSWGRVAHNDLESVVIPRFSEIGVIKESLLEQGALTALMTGSGPTVFGVFESIEKASNAHKSLTDLGGGKWVVLTAQRYSHRVLS